jgi:hypothetical protein
MAVKWRRLLGEKYPELAKQADFWDSIDASDNTTATENKKKKK